MSKSSTLPLYVVEAFTLGKNDIFTGNTAAVCLLDFDDDLRDDTKQKIAMNMNLSETAFVSKGWTHGKYLDTSSKPISRWTLRWFTPTMEVPLCGHATLASANVIFHEILKRTGNEVETSIAFESKFRGQLGATMDWTTDLIILNFPGNPTIPMSIREHNWVRPMIENTLGPEIPLEAVDDIQYSPDTLITVLRLKDTGKGASANQALVKKVSPNFQNLLQVKADDGLKIHDVIITIKGDSSEEGPHCFSRFFAPWSGINEDPVTGVAHTILAPYWNKEFQKEGKNLIELVAVQASHRGGKLICTVQGDRVRIKGSTRAVLKGHFIL